MDFLNIVTETEEEFETIASMLFDNFAIQTNKTMYRFVEIEFYWNSPNHVDNSTYKRKHVDPKAGDWFFHYSGVDIALKSEEGRGGILIRKVFDFEKNEHYPGPMVCAMRLFSGTNAFSDSIMTKLVKHSFPTNVKIKNDKRIGLGENAKENGAHEFPYRFFIDINELK